MFKNQFAAKLVAVLLFIFTATVASAQPTKFGTAQQCIAAIESGNYGVYKASYLHPRPLPSGYEVFRPESPTCYRMKVVYNPSDPAIDRRTGKSWVVQDESVELVRTREKKVVWRKDCGNEIDDEAVPQPKPVPPPQVGCIDVVKETVSADNVYIRPTGQFTVSLDDGRQAVTDSEGHALFTNVSLGDHTITEEDADGWEQIQITPRNGRVRVIAGSKCVAVTIKNRQVLPPVVTQAPPPPPPPPVEEPRAPFACVYNGADENGVHFAAQNGVASRFEVMLNGKELVASATNASSILAPAALLKEGKNSVTATAYDENGVPHTEGCRYEYDYPKKGKSVRRFIPCASFSIISTVSCVAIVAAGAYIAHEKLEGHGSPKPIKVDNPTIPPGTPGAPPAGGTPKPPIPGN